MRLSWGRSITLLVAFFLLGPQASWSAEGLVVEIENVVINSDLKPVVTYTLKDNEGNPVTVGSEAGQASIRFMIAVLEPNMPDVGSYLYRSYNVRTQTVPEGSPNAGASAEQATYDSGGTNTELEPGKYEYVFNTALPAGYDQTLTHTVSGQFQRTIDDVRYVANPLYHFVPNGSDVVTLRKIATTDGCNKCHTDLGIHGGSRMEVGLCILCHQPQSVDPDTGNSVDMTEMIHKIHRGASLPSVQAGNPYVIVGNNQSVHDYSHVVFPMDNRNCTACHTGEQGDIWKKAPSRRTCGSCHDDIDFAAGVGHIAQADDSMCKLCHQAEGNEFDISIPGAHTIPTKSKALKGLNAEIIEVTNTAPGQNPIVRFTLKENDGKNVDIASLNRLTIMMARPTVEYSNYIQENALTASVQDGDTWLYTFVAPIPADVEGTVTFAIETRRTVVVKDNPGDTEDITVTEGALNPLKFVAVTGTEVTQRRMIVDQAKCHDCHGELSLHGSQRKTLEYCVTCHNPNVSDIGRRPEGIGGGVSVSFSYMIHKIHTGEELGNDYTVYGFGNTPHNYNHVLFPGNRQACNICHVDEIPELPLAPEVNPISFTDKDGNAVFIAATTAACISCHDNEEAITHANQFNANGVESCDQCHGPGKFKDIANDHRLMRFLNVEETIKTSTSVKGWNIH